MSKRVTKKDWVQAGLKLLSEGGAGALTIERLCQRLAKTKGSFYHHFGEMDRYIGALLHHWGYEQTQKAIEYANAGATAADRMALLEKIVQTLDHHLDMVVRQWAKQEPRAAEAVKAVDAQRLAYLSELYAGFGVTKAQADELAELEYTAFIGAQLRFTDLQSDQARNISLTTHKAIHALIASWQSET